MPQSRESTLRDDDGSAPRISFEYTEVLLEDTVNSMGALSETFGKGAVNSTVESGALQEDIECLHFGLAKIYNSPVALNASLCPYSNLADANLENFALLRDCSTEHLRAKEGPLGLFDHLLVNALRGVIHHHGARLVVDLRIHLGVSNQVDDPFLPFVLGKAKSFGKVPERRSDHFTIKNNSRLT